MSKSHTIREFGIIFNKKDYPDHKDNFNEIFVEERSFNSLRNFIAENVNEDIEVDNAFSVHRKKAQDFIRVKNYVGVIETKDGTSIEILPKIFLDAEVEEKLETRRIFLKMLRHLKDTPFKSIDNALLKTTKFPILEIFIIAFLEELDVLIKKGIRKKYLNKNDNIKFLKGSLDFSKQIQFNLLHKERFYVNFDEFNIDIPQNRILKSCLVYLLKITRSPKNKIRIHTNLNFLEELGESKNINKDFIRIKNSNRLFAHYKQVMQWSKVFLLGESFTNFKGNNLNKAILFPMERIFEDYIGHGFKKYSKDYDVSLQEKQKALVNLHRNSQKFKLKPDIVLYGKDNLFVLDTKWKIINQENSRTNYGISQSDMYQLYAYGKKYINKEESVHIMPYLALLYPMQEMFSSPLADFEYEDDLKLKVIPVRLNCSLEESITSIFELVNGILY